MNAKYLTILLILGVLFVISNTSYGCVNPPVAVLIAEPEYIGAGETVTLDGSGSYDIDEGGYITKYEWDFDYNGTFVCDESETPPCDGMRDHVYNTEGVHTAALRVTDNTSRTSNIDTCKVYVGRVWNITKNPPAYYSTIQAAINDASDGNTIVATKYTYNESITLYDVFCTVKSVDPNDPDVVAATIIHSLYDSWPAVAFGYIGNGDCVLNGFTITGGFDGIECYASPTITNCIIKDNEYYGIYVFGCDYDDCEIVISPTITNCIIEDNGSGIWAYNNFHASVKINNCLIERNKGDGVHNVDPTSSLIENNIIRRNDGHGILIDYTDKNEDANWYGEDCLDCYPSPNTTPRRLYATFSGIDLCPGVNDNPNVTYIVKQSDDNPCCWYLGEDPEWPNYITYCVHIYNYPDYYSEARFLGLELHTLFHDWKKADCATFFNDNSYECPGGGGEGGQAEFTPLLIPEHPETYVVKVRNNWIHHNQGHGIYAHYIYERGQEIRNNTITNNNGYGLRASSTWDAVTVSNCILWGNDVGQLYSCSATYSCIQGCDEENGNINDNPSFLNPSDPNDYHIVSNSPCIDAGDDDQDYTGETDIDASSRIVNISGKGNGINDIDMGADEYDPNFVSLWMFDEGSGNTASDSIGDNDGTIDGASWTSGKIGGALSFDGANDYVNIGNDIFDSQSQGTITAWIKLNSINTNAILTANNNENKYNSRNYFFVNNAKLSYYAEGRTDGDERTTTSIKTLDSNKWYFVAVTVNSTNTCLYINGGLDATTNYNYWFSQGAGSGTGTSYYHIGNLWYETPSTFWFNGVIDDVRVYKRALSVEEIWQLYLESSS